MVGLGFGLGVTTVGSRVLLTSLAALSQALVSQIESGELATSTYNWDTTAIFKDDGTGNPSVGETLDGCTILDSSQFGGKTAEQWIAGLTEMADSFTVGADWSWDGSTLTGLGSGGGSTASAGTATVAGDYYYLEYTSSGTGLFQVRVGNTFVATEGNTTVTRKRIVKATDTAGLVLTSSASFDGTVTVTFKHLSGNHTVASGTGPTLLDEFDQSAPALTDNGGRGEELVDYTDATLAAESSVAGNVITNVGDASVNVDTLTSTVTAGDLYEVEVTNITEVVAGSGSFQLRMKTSAGDFSDVVINNSASVGKVLWRPTGSGNLELRWFDVAGDATISCEISVKRISTAFDERGGELVENGTFDSDVSGWQVFSDPNLSAAYSSGTAALTRSGSITPKNCFGQNISVTSGDVYEITFEMSSSVGSAVGILNASDAGMNDIDGNPVGALGNQDGAQKYIVQANSAEIRLRFWCNDGETTNVDNISVRQVIYPNLVTNGTFDTDSDWTKGTGWTISGGQADFDGNTAFSQLSQDALGGVGSRAWCSCRFYLVSKGSNISTLRFVVGGANVYLVDVSSGAGWYTVYFRRHVTGGAVSFQAGSGTSGANDAFSIDNVIVQEVPSTIARTYYAEFNGTDDALTMALPARRNLLINSEDLTQSSWIKAGVSVSAAAEGYEVLAPSGTGHRRFYVNRPAATGPATWYMDVSAGTHDTFQLYNGGSANSLATFDLTTGAVVHEGSETNASMIDLGGGIYRCIATFTRTDLTGAYWFGLAPKGATSYGHQLNSDQDETIIVHRGQLETGSTATAYQSIGSDWMDDMMVSIAFRTSDTQGMLVNSDNVIRWLGAFNDSDTSTDTIGFGSGSPVMRLDGVAVTPANRDALHALVSDGDWHVATISAADLSSWSDVVQAFYSASSAWNANSDIVGLVIAPNTTENIELAEAALAEAMEPVGYAI